MQLICGMVGIVGGEEHLSCGSVSDARMSLTRVSLSAFVQKYVSFASQCVSC